MSDIFAALAAPFDPADVCWRIGSTTKDKTRGMALAYVDARAVQDRFNEVLTPYGWQNEYVMGHDKRITCRIGISLHVANAVLANAAMPENPFWVWKSDGAGETDFEGEKGSYSDSFKRAAVKWGVGRYLYDLEAPWVELENEGRKIKASELAKLSALLPAPSKLSDVEIAKLVIQAGAESNEGMDSYKDFYESLGKEHRLALKPYHDQFKQNAQTVTQQKKAA
jgi:hypothetical protein